MRTKTDKLSGSLSNALCTRGPRGRCGCLSPPSRRMHAAVPSGKVGPGTEANLAYGFQRSRSRANWLVQLAHPPESYYHLHGARMSVLSQAKWNTGLQISFKSWVFSASKSKSHESPDFEENEYAPTGLTIPDQPTPQKSPNCLGRRSSAEAGDHERRFSFLFNLFLFCV